MFLYLKGKKKGRMMLESIQSGPLVYPTIEENGQVRDKKYAELTEQEKLQDDCDVQAINIILQVLPPDVNGIYVAIVASHFPLTNSEHLLIQETKLPFNMAWLLFNKFKEDKNAAFQTDDLDVYDSECDDISSAKTVLMANLLSYDSDILSDVPQHDFYQNDDMVN
nr:hypothetical protein [Tanacetum cinerariifolium]